MKTHASSCSFIFALGENSNLASPYSFSQLCIEDESRSSSIKMCAAVHVRLYHLSARLIKLDSLFAVVVNAAAWSGEIIFLHALLTLFLFSPSTRPQFLFVWLFFFLFLFLFTNRLLVSHPPTSLYFYCCHSKSVTRLSRWLSALRILSLFDLPTFVYLPSPTIHKPRLQIPQRNMYGLWTLVKGALEGCLTQMTRPYHSHYVTYSMLTVTVQRTL